MGRSHGEVIWRGYKEKLQGEVTKRGCTERLHGEVTWRLNGENAAVAPEMRYINVQLHVPS